MGQTASDHCINIQRSKHQQNRSYHRDRQRPLKYYPHVTGAKISIIWGGKMSSGFQRRASRAIYAMDAEVIRGAYLLSRSPNSRFEVAVKGILGRNKGNKPWLLIGLGTLQEVPATIDYSPHSPRPAKTQRALRVKAFMEEYEGLGTNFVGVATELALLMADIPLPTLCRWLDLECEQQDHEWAWSLYDNVSPAAAELAYLLQYVTMLTSLNGGASHSGEAVRVAPRPEAMTMVVYLVLGGRLEGGNVAADALPRSLEQVRAYMGLDSWLPLASRLKEELKHYRANTVALIGAYTGCSTVSPGRCQEVYESITAASRVALN
jgi:hypothetical protein